MAAHARFLTLALGLASSATAQPIVARGPHVSEKGDVGTVSLGDLAGVETVHLDDDGSVAYSHGAIVPSIPYLAATPDVGHRLSNATAAHVFDVYVSPLCEDTRAALPAIRAVAAHYEGEVEVRVRLAPLSDIDGDFDLAWGLHAVKLASPEKFWDFFFLIYDEQPAFKMAWALNMSVRERAAYQAEHFAAKVGANVTAFSAQLAAAGDAHGMPAAFWNAKAEWKRTVLRGVYGTPSFALNGIAIPEIGDASGSGLAHLAAAHWIAAIDRTLAFSPW